MYIVQGKFQAEGSFYATCMGMVVVVMIPSPSPSSRWGEMAILAPAEIAVRKHAAMLEVRRSMSAWVASGQLFGVVPFPFLLFKQ